MLYTNPTTTDPSWLNDPLYWYPATEDGWKNRYDQLWRAYLAEPYSIGELKHHHLFRALDTDGKEIDAARRMHRHFPFIVDTDVRGVLGSTGGGGSLVLEVPDGVNRRVLPAGEVIWRRSQLATRMERWVRSLAVMGDRYIAAVRTNRKRPYRARLVSWDPRCVEPTYNEYGDLVKVCVEVSQGEGDVLNPRDGTMEEETIHTTRWEIDATSIKVYIDGVLDEARSGEHGLGVLPVVHVQWTPFTEPEHGLPAGHPLDMALMQLDSLACQIRAIGNRYGNPTGVVIGAKIGESLDTSFGRWLNIAGKKPADVSINYLQAGEGVIPALMENIKQIAEHIERTAPEFLFADSSAQESGTAKGYRAAAFENLVGSVRNRIFTDLARVTEYAVALDEDRQTDPDAQTYRVDAPPILPRNIEAMVNVLQLARQDLTALDRTRALQSVGLADPAADPVEYAREVADESAARATTFFAPNPATKPTDPAAGGANG
jgi:hypothetical protein